MNNKPIAVLVDIDEYEDMMAPELIELSEDEITPELRKMAEQAVNTPDEDL